MTKYRILEKNGRFYPQKRIFGFWYSFYNMLDTDWAPHGFRKQVYDFVPTMEEAKAIINRDYKQKRQINPVTKVHHYNPEE